GAVMHLVRVHEDQLARPRIAAAPAAREGLATGEDGADSIGLVRVGGVAVRAERGGQAFQTAEGRGCKEARPLVSCESHYRDSLFLSHSVQTATIRESFRGRS